MLIVPAQAPSAQWTPVMGGEVLFDPIDRAMLIRARRAARAAQADAGDEQSDADTVDPLDLIEMLGAAFSVALIMEGARDWRNVGTQRLDDNGDPVLDDNGTPIFDPLPFSIEALALALTDPIVFEAFDAAYVVPFVARERERAEPGNVSPASPTGIGEAEMLASDIASSAAKPGTEADATPAPTSKASRKRKPKRPFGEP